MRFLKSLFGPSKLDQDAHTLYGLVINQSRQPRFYQPPFSAPDSMEGRFEVIVLHLAICEFFLTGSEQTMPLRRAVQELLVKDMDRSLRELGIGDMSIGKQMKKVGAGLIGRLQSYESAVDLEDEESTKNAVGGIIERNIEGSNAKSANEFANYFWQQLHTVNAIDRSNWTVDKSIFG